MNHYPSHNIVLYYTKHLPVNNLILTAIKTQTSFIFSMKPFIPYNSFHVLNNCNTSIQFPQISTQCLTQISEELKFQMVFVLNSACDRGSK
jgi:hypothetical protein